MAEIKIDARLFQERISHFATSWKNDIRTKDGLFGGATALVVMMGKVEEVPELHKNNAVHVSHNRRVRLAIARLTTDDDSFGFSATSSPRR